MGVLGWIPVTRLCACYVQVQLFLLPPQVNDPCKSTQLPYNNINPASMAIHPTCQPSLQNGLHVPCWWLEVIYINPVFATFLKSESNASFRSEQRSTSFLLVSNSTFSLYEKMITQVNFDLESQGGAKLAQERQLLASFHTNLSES